MPRVSRAVKDEHSGLWIDPATSELLHNETEAYIFEHNEIKYWFNNGLQHRDHGPAVEVGKGTYYWIKYGKRHRSCGPAYVSSGGSETWYLNDIDITPEVVQWLSENPEIPHWSKWTDADELLFVLRFS